MLQLEKAQAQQPRPISAKYKKIIINLIVPIYYDYSCFSSEKLKGRNKKFNPLSKVREAEVGF